MGLGGELPILIWLTSLLGCFTLAGIAIQQAATTLTGAPLGSLLNCLELGIAPALDEQWREDPQLLHTATHEWARRAAGLLDRAKRAGMPPDAIVGLWQTERLLGADARKAASKAPASIRMPPMFECAWRWAVARSTVDRNALQDFASIRAAAKSAGGTAPWLCWSAAAAKALQNPAPAASDDELDALLLSVVRKMRELRQQQERTTSAFILPHSLPAEAVATALRAEQVVERPGKGQDHLATPVAALAVALSLPLAALAARLVLTDQALDDALAQGSGERSRRASDGDADAPGWRKKVKVKDDPNRGRFGGASERDGFKLEAEFNHSKSKNWVTIHLAIVGPAGFDGTAVLYLHNSYKPPRYDYRFKDGIVRDRLTAWGGFTVGAWIPSQRVELELDLAAVDGAPAIIRER